MGHLVPQWLRAVDDVLQETPSERGPPGAPDSGTNSQSPAAQREEDSTPGLGSAGGIRKEGRTARSTELCENPAPHLVDELPDVLLSQVLHHILEGKGCEISPSPALLFPEKPSVPLQSPSLQSITLGSWKGASDGCTVVLGSPVSLGSPAASSASCCTETSPWVWDLSVVLGSQWVWDPQWLQVLLIALLSSMSLASPTASSASCCIWIPHEFGIFLCWDPQWV